MIRKPRTVLIKIDDTGTNVFIEGKEVEGLLEFAFTVGVDQPPTMSITQNMTGSTIITKEVVH